MPATRSQIEQRLAASRLVTSAQWEQLRSELDETADGEALIHALVEQKLLTPWQAAQLKAGNTSFLLDHDRYVVLDKLGQGGMGAVYRARHIRLNRDVALKVIDPKKVQDPQVVARFRREVEISARLEHEHIVRALDVGEHGGVSFLIMEYVEGSDLASLVKCDGPMAADEAAAIAIQAASGLAHAHTLGIVHRDVKPHNLLLSTDGVTKVLDLGLARDADGPADSRTSLTQEGTVMGTLDYMAPEQGVDTHGVDARCDVYSLGATLYFLLTGRPPFSGGTMLEKIRRIATEDPQSLAQIRPDLPRELVDTVERMMAKSPHDRLKTMEEVVRALQPLAADSIAGRPVVTPSVQAAAETHRHSPYARTIDDSPLFVPDETPATHMIRRRRSSNMVPIAAIAGCAVLVGLVAWFASGARDESKAGPVQQAGGNPAASSNSPPSDYRVDFGGHFGAIYAVAWAPGASAVATTAADGRLLIWDMAGRRLMQECREHRGRTLALDWSPRGDLIASSDEDGYVRLWNAQSGKQVHALAAGFPAQVRFSPNGTEIATSGPSIARWSTSDGKRIWSRGGSGAYDLSYSTDGRFLALAGKPLLVWDLKADRVVLEDRGEEIGFGGATTLGICSSGLLRFVEMPSGKELFRREFAQTHPSSNMFRISRGGHVILRTAAGGDRIDIATQQVEAVSSFGAYMGTLNDDASRMAIRDDLGRIHVFRMRTAETTEFFGTIGSTIEPGEARIDSNRYLVINSRSHGYCWDLVGAERIKGFPNHGWVAADGTVRALTEAGVKIWREGSDADGDELVELEKWPADANDVGWSRDGTVLWAMSHEKATPAWVRVWNAKTGKLRHEVVGNRVSFRAVVSDDGSTVATYDAEARNHLESRIHGNSESPFNVAGHNRYAISSSGNRLVASTNSAQDSVVLDLDSRSEVTRIEHGYTYPRSVNFSPRGRYLLILDKLWDLETKRMAWQCPEQNRAEHEYLDAAFLDEDRVVVTHDGHYTLWNWRKNEKLLTLFILSRGGKEWAIVNHQTGQWKGSTFAFKYLRLKHTDAKGHERWLSPRDYEATNGWENDPSQAGLKAAAN